MARIRAHAVAAAPPRSPHLIGSALPQPFGRKDAWRVLGQQWGLVVEGGDPVLQATQQQLACFRSNSGLGPLQLLNRPAVLTLLSRQGWQDRLRPAGWACRPNKPRCRLASKPTTSSLAELSRMWRGDFGTLSANP